ncbi:MAG: DUF2188 domain-containing protein [Pseudomonas sp.]|nr:DUF2188 domain-containing protein [Pseudomonas sp.]
MSAPVIEKVHVNGYHLVSVHNSQWSVCTPDDRLASFGTREEAAAYAFALPAKAVGADSSAKASPRKA